MKRTTTNKTSKREQNTSTAPTLRDTCVTCYEKALAQIAAVKEMIFSDSKQALSVPERLLRLALNEAEAMAWQTTYPHLLFPALATEKVQAVAAWNANQQFVRRSSPVLALTK